MTTPQFRPPQPQYQPGPPPPPPPPGPPSPGPSKLIASILAAVTAVLALVGSLLPLNVLKQSLSAERTIIQTVTAWSRTSDPAPTGAQADYYASTHVAYYGVPLTLLAVVLLAAAVLGVLTARRVEGNGTRNLLLIGGSGLVATVLTLGMDVSSVLSYEHTDDTIKLEYSTGLGFWLEIAAGVLALAAVVLILVPARRHRTDYAPQFAPPGYEQQYVRTLPPQEQQPPQPMQQAYQPPVQQYGPPSQPFPVPPQQHQQQQPPLFPPD
ncbi:hypothetical protein [Amycolatopsis sp. H20-H5]|uniref:hypothetical protein n=1 Tax=Amycolatopsis sp. H20-H5 TaxID=3046309 RepID=UPI002DB66523|nr:hypothetical protein [Amycolatopsis sp. H20-H5]MEC3973907.1 hypothetical protein [Amycolatopsis sp. H20-H5]